MTEKYLRQWNDPTSSEAIKLADKLIKRDSSSPAINWPESKIDPNRSNFIAGNNRRRYLPKTTKKERRQQ